MIIRCNNLCFNYGTNEVIKNLSINFKKGSLYGILGPNGSGKTTLVKLLSGILKPLSGNIEVDNHNIKNYKSKELAKKMALVTQIYSSEFDFKVRNLILLGRYAHIDRLSIATHKDKEIVDKIISDLGLKQLALRNFSELSGGEQQKVMIARALAQQGKILILDEPTAHLDIKYQIELMSMLKNFAKDGMTIIAVLHDINLAAMFCDELILINNGSIHASGPVENILTSKNIRCVFHVDVNVKKNTITESYYVVPLHLDAGINISLIENHKEIHIHLIAGGGSGKKVMYHLKNLDVSVGVLNVLDEDYNTATELGFEIISEAPFSPISAKNENLLRKILGKSDIILLCNIPFGNGNLKNLEVLNSIDKKIIILEENPIEERDFTKGLATDLYNELKKKTHVYVISDLKELNPLIGY
ncbi:MAG: ABC transporter ATP-binding protein [Promethearchaeota archaeon]